MRAEKSSSKVQLKVRDTIHIVDTERVIFLKSLHNSVLVTETDHRSWPIDVSIDEMERALKGYSFWRTDEDHLVNLNFLNRIPSTAGETVLYSHDYSIPVDKTRMQMLLDALTEL